MANDPIVIVGGGLAAARLASEYREAGGEADVTILSSDSDPPYNRPPLTKGYLRGEQDRDSTLVQPLEAYEDAVVELRLGEAVEEIDAQAHEVELAGGSDWDTARSSSRPAPVRDCYRSPGPTWWASTPTGRSRTPRR